MIAGRRRRSGLDLGRHPRRRWVAWAIFGLVGAIVIGEVAADIVNSGPPAADVAARSYAAAVVPIIEESTALRLWLTDVRQNAPKLGRLGLETALGRLVAGARNLQYQAANLGIPAPSRRSARLLSDVLASHALSGPSRDGRRRPCDRAVTGCDGRHRSPRQGRRRAGRVRRRLRQLPLLSAKACAPVGRVPVVRLGRAV